MKAGIATIYQELDLVEDMSVAENVYLGHEPRSLGFVNAGKARARPGRSCASSATARSRRAGWCASLPAAGKQLVSMARALSHRRSSSSWTSRARCWRTTRWSNLFRIIRELTAQGIAVVYISHRLEEIREIGDRVTVLKDGRTSAVEPAGPHHPDPRSGEPHDRPHHRIRLPAARRPSRARSCWRSTGSTALASSTTCR